MNSAIWLRREGDDVVVLVEIDGQWVERIRERADGAFSHIAEPPHTRRPAPQAEKEIAAAQWLSAGPGEDNNG